MRVNRFLSQNVGYKQKIRVVLARCHTQDILFEGYLPEVKQDNPYIFSGMKINQITFYTVEHHDLDEDIIEIHCHEEEDRLG